MSGPWLEETEFATAPIPRRRRGDAVASAIVVLVVAALALAIAKPWDAGRPAASGEPSASPGRSRPPASASAPPGPVVVAPNWADIGPVISGRDEWGIRLITADQRYHELWQPADPTPDTATSGPGGAKPSAPTVLVPGLLRVVALGVTFPPAEAPLDMRVWLEHGDAGLEWVDARPVNDLPGLGAYLLERPGSEPATERPWEPGRYRIDVLVGHAIRTIEVDVRDTFGKTAVPAAWPETVDGGGGVSAAGLLGLSAGLFTWAGGAAVALPASAGPSLNATDAWLNLDLSDVDGSPRSFVGRASAPGTTAVGVVLPPSSEVQSATLRSLEPTALVLQDDQLTTTVSAGATSFVAFSRASGGAWRPGVYAIRVAWLDGAGSHDRTWHLELRPGDVVPTPWLLAATRAWAHLSGFTGVLLGTTAGSGGDDPSTEVGLLPITPQDGSTYPGLTAVNLIGCGATLVRGHPSVIGFVGSPNHPLVPVGAAIQYPFYDVGQMQILTAAGAVPHLVVVSPRLTGAFEGPAAYGFRLGVAPDGPGYTICIDMRPQS